MRIGVIRIGGNRFLEEFDRVGKFPLFQLTVAGTPQCRTVVSVDLQSAVKIRRCFFQLALRDVYITAFRERLIVFVIEFDGPIETLQSLEWFIVTLELQTFVESLSCLPGNPLLIFIGSDNAGLRILCVIGSVPKEKLDRQITVRRETWVHFNRIRDKIWIGWGGRGNGVLHLRHPRKLEPAGIIRKPNRRRAPGGPQGNQSPPGGSAIR